MISSEKAAYDWCMDQFGAGVCERLTAFSALLHEENQQQNLVSQASLAHVWQRHIQDSLQLLKYVPRETVAWGLWLDLGSGAGLPGLPIALALPAARIHLVESRKKRIEWLEGAIVALGLHNCTVLGEKLQNIPAQRAAVISARAFAPLDRLIKLSRRFSTPDTVWLLPKGRSGAQELHEQPKRIRELFHVEQSISDPEAAILVGKGSLQ